MKKIVQGYYKFFDQYFEKKKKYQKLFKAQSPSVMFIACCDSRVDPALLVSAEPGDIFVERNVANVVPHPDDGSSAIMIALEVALCNFEVKDLIIMGHQRCAGVEMLLMDKLDCFGKAPAEYLRREKDLKKLSKKYNSRTAKEFEKMNLQLSCKNLLAHELVAQRVKSKKLNVHGWYFSLNTGKFDTLCFKCHTFTDLMNECCGQKVV